MDPDGRIFFNKFEAQFVKEVLGNNGLYIYYTTAYFPFSKDGRSGSFPFVYGMIFYDKATYNNPIENGKNIFIHEIFHQVQYLTNPLSFLKLIEEFGLNNQMANEGSIIGSVTLTRHDESTYKKYFYDGITKEDYTYGYEKWNLSKMKNYNNLSDLPYFESQAQFVGDYAELYFNERYGESGNDYDRKRLYQMSRIMSNSGYENTEAVKWCQENLKDYQ